MEITGKNRDGNDVTIQMVIRGEKNGGSSTVVMVSTGGGPTTEIYQGPCLFEPRQENYNELQSVFDSSYDAWLNKKRKS